jgi:hypothetical protein
MAGSSGSSGRYFQGSGAGGGALELKAEGAFCGKKSQAFWF